MRSIICYFFCIIFTLNCFAQDIELFQQFNGRYDYISIGNTLNLEENGPFGNCTILTESSAELLLQPTQIIQAAFLYWAGSDTGDFDVLLNNNPVSAERIFSDSLDATRVFFAAFADVTDIILAEGNGIYTLSELDLTQVITPYCSTGTNFGGWAISIIYQQDSLPLNQINIYDGLQSVPTNLTIELNSLNVLDNVDAKIGFIAWEGDAALAINETLTINGNIIGNPPLNPTNNAFNGTNSFTGESDLYNMDIDVYNIQNNISVGDTSATIQLTSGQDFVMINNIITVLNSQLPDATVLIDDYLLQCNSDQFLLTYTVSNTNSTAILPANTPIAIYIDNELVVQASTENDININDSETYSLNLTIPAVTNTNFNLEIVVDDDGTGSGIINEIVETNNSNSVLITQLLSEPLIELPLLLGCDEGFNMNTFNLTSQLILIDDSFDLDSAQFYTNLNDANTGLNAILTPTSFTNQNNPQTVFIRIENSPCFQLFQFDLLVENCPPLVPQGFSPNEDGFNDWFNIQGLYDIFDQHQLLIYNRHGTLIFQGDNSLKWFGKSNKGLNAQGKIVPVGTYFYVLHLNDPNFKSLTGWVYLNY
jgi:gliding motility-associated-like protein